ncbi:MAG: 30S ribosome-binding factor RbfA [Bacteroidetes bacterium]|nr:30S ribosome-binding factor RbfA [Bacteroidota bacterium]
MGTVRQQKIEAAIRQELSMVLLMKSSEIAQGAMVTITVVRITSDLSLARCYLSVFGSAEPSKVLESVNSNSGIIRKEVGKRLKNMRKIPDLRFFIDDSMDYADNINSLLKK